MTTREAGVLIISLAGIAGNLLFQDSLAAGEESNWAIEQLHNPSASLKKVEHAGRISIYDGVAVADVESAMDRQFDRIQSMMFIRTKYPMADGTFEADDDCD